MQEKKFKKIGARIKELREEKKWTQVGLASRVGVTQQSIRDMEDGKIKPADPTLIALSDVFRVPLPDIYPDIDIDLEKRGREFLKE